MVQGKALAQPDTLIINLHNTPLRGVSIEPPHNEAVIWLNWGYLVFEPCTHCLAIPYISFKN